MANLKNVRQSPQGALQVEPTGAVPGYPGVWAIGDCAALPLPQGQGTYAPTAQNAVREGVLIAGNILASLGGEPAQPFTYRPIGTLALVGRHAGVAEIYGWPVSGLFAWAMWRAVYLAKMPGLGQRARILLDWWRDARTGGGPSLAQAQATRPAPPWPTAPLRFHRGTRRCPRNPHLIASNKTR